MIANNKGFSMVELLAVVVLLGILASIAIFGVSRYKTKAINDDYEALAKSSYNAMQEYIMTNPYETEANIGKLEEQRFLSNRKDPASKEADCEGAVVYESKSGTAGSMDEGKYTVYLCCPSHKKKYTFPGGKVENITDDTYCDVSSEPEPPGPTTVTCSAGKYLPKNSESCATCTSGNYCKGGTWTTSTTKDQGLTECPSGYKNSPAGSTKVEQCYMKVTAGNYVKNKKDTSVTSCGKGTYKVSHNVNYNSTSKCENCPKGYRDGPGTTKKENCMMNVPKNNYVRKSRDSSPTPCPSGQLKPAHQVRYGGISSCIGKTITVTFNCNGGTRSGSATSTYYSDRTGQKFKTTCKKDGSSQDGWKRDKEGNAKNYETASGVSENFVLTYAPKVTLYAHWKVNKYKCSAGNYLPKNSTVCKQCIAGNYCPGGEWSKSTTKDQGLNPCPSGYKNSAAGSDAANDCYMKVPENKYVKTAKATSATACPSGQYKEAHNVHYGKVSSCSSKSITVTFNCNGGTRNSGPTSATYKSDVTGQKFTTTCTRSGYIQDGWKRDKNGSTRNYTTNSNISENFVLTYSPKLTIYAHWKENKKYTINLKKGTGISSVSLDGSTTVLTKTVTAGTKVKIDATKADFYSFSKWSDGNATKSRTITVNSNLNLTAEATENTLVIRYHTNGGTLGAGKPQVCPQSINCSKTICTDNPKNSPYCTGNKTGIVYITGKLPFNSTALSSYGLSAYHYKDYASLYTVNSGYKGTDNWLVGSNKSTIRIDEDTPFPKVRDLAKAMKKEEDLKKGSIEVTVYAEWLKNVYTIEYSLDGGTVSPANPISYTSTTETFTLRNPTKSGYTFLGWTTTSGGTDYKKTVTIPKGSTGDKVFFAKWKANSKKYTINLKKGTGISTVKLNGKTSPLSLTVEAGTKVTIDATPADYYSFSKWSDGNATKSRTITVNSDITYTATGRKNKVIINYYRNGGTIVTSDPKQKGKNADPCYTSSADYDNTSSMKLGLLDYAGGGGLTMTRANCEADGYWIYGSPSGTKGAEETKEFNSRIALAKDVDATNATKIKTGDVSVSVYAKWSCTSKYTCTAGYYLPANATTCKKCESSYYCPGGTWSKKNSIQGRNTCPSGYGNSAEGSSKQKDCFMKVNANRYVKNSKDSSSTACATGYEKAAHNVYYEGTSSCTIKKFTVKVTKGTGIKTVYLDNSSSTLTKTVNYGTKIKINATASDYYQFTKWSDNNTTKSREITVTSNLTLTANARKNKMSLDRYLNGGKLIPGKLQVCPETAGCKKNECDNKKNASGCSKTNTTTGIIMKGGGQTYDSTVFSKNGTKDYCGKEAHLRAKKSGKSCANSKGKSYWIVGSPSGKTKINQDTPYDTVKAFVHACGSSYEEAFKKGDITIKFYAEWY